MVLLPIAEARRAALRCAAVFLLARPVLWVVGGSVAREATESVGQTPDAAAWASESAVLAHLASVQEKEEDLSLLRLCVRRSWWAAAREIVSRSHGRGAEVGESASMLHKEVRTLLAEVKRGADDFAAYADSTYRGQTKGLDEVHCAVQWAQNSSHVFLGVKYAARWSAPGAIEVVDVKVNITSCCFELEGFGHHSNIRKRYVVNLSLFEGLLPEQSSWYAASVGRLTATLQKAKIVKWPRLLKSKDKHASKSMIGKWLDMEEKWESEMQKTSKAKDTKTEKRPEKKAKDKGNHSKASVGDRISKSISKTIASSKKKLRRWWRQIWRRRITLAVGSLVAASLVLVISIAQLRRQRTSTDGADTRQRAAEAAQARIDTKSDARGVEKATVGKAPEGGDASVVASLGAETPPDRKSVV